MKMEKQSLPLIEAQRALAEENHNLIYYCLKKYKFDNIEDYYDVAAIGLCKAARSYRSQCGQFSTFACRVIQNELYQTLRKKRITAISFHTSLRETDGALTVLDMISGSESTEDGTLDAIAFMQAFHALPPDKQRVIRLLANGATQQEVAAMTGYSKTKVSRTLAKLKAAFYA